MSTPDPLVTPDLPDATIQVIFQGLFVAHLEAELAQVGAIVDDDEPCHRPKITITRRKNGVYVDEINVAKRLDVKENNFDKGFELIVAGTPQTGIRKFQNPDKEFNREEGKGDKQDFRWFIDLERDILSDPQKAVQVNTQQIKPVFQLHKGVFHTVNLTEAPVLLLQAGPPKAFGRIARTIAANIELDQAGGAAILKTDEGAIFMVTPDDVRNGFTYQIMFDCDCPELPKTLLKEIPEELLVSDFITIFKEAVTGFDAAERPNLKRDEAGSFNREVICGGLHTAQALQ
ncbi:MAG TPA: hypothetical protein VJ464_05845 [Blastocatellia bacterium]|nr:hypothetical protein [Blastocatellia bacterium]